MTRCSVPCVYVQERACPSCLRTWSRPRRPHQVGLHERRPDNPEPGKKYGRSIRNWARLIADRAKQVDELMKNAQEADSAPSGFSEFVIGKVKEMYPHLYANYEKTWQAFQKKRDSVKNRARDISLRFGNLLEADEHKHNDESQYY